MERLTYWNEDHECWSYRGPSGNAAIRLAAYEDTGLEPEEIYRERFLIVARKDPEKLARLRELIDADADGRLVVLPCSLHQPLYILKNDEIHRNYGCQWHFTGKESQTFGTISLYGEFVSIYDFGKTVFLTREEAEAALKKREDARDD